MQPAGARRLRDEDAAPEELPRARNLHLVGDVEPVVAENGRRTVRISGHPGPARRRRSPAAAQIEARPDRIALWAVLLGLFLVFMAVATANAATV